MGHLTIPTHDAAGATLGGQTYVFGGGQQTSVATVQEITAHQAGAAHGTAAVAGQLPGPRSDLVAVTHAGTAYLLGGYDGAGYDATVLATRDGRRFTVAARLAVPVRYPAVAVLGQPDLGLRRADQPRNHERHPADPPARCQPHRRRSDRWGAGESLRAR